jgi:predicted tellurium resistance membrane protein TerC
VIDLETGSHSGFPIIITLGAAVLAFTAAKMVVSEPLLKDVFGPEGTWQFVARMGTYVLAIAGVLGLGWLTSRRAAQQSANTTAA